jgi:hypothetical protein
MQTVRFTRAFLRSVTPPEKGELWVADAKVRGFGLRLWWTKSGGQRAFAIRVRDSSGVVRRKTFDPRSTSTYRLAVLDRTDDPEVADLLDNAREWAHDEIAKLKGRLTQAERQMLRWRRELDRASSLTLGQAAQQLLDDMMSRGLTKSYIDQQNKLFHQIIPKVLQETNVTLVEPAVIAASLVRRDIKPGNIRVLRSFIGQIQHIGAIGGFREALAKEFWRRWEAEMDVRFPELRDLHAGDYHRLFDLLEHDERWQPALCIRLFFEFAAPLSRLMAAQWSQILDEFWYPYWPDERILWFEGRQQIKDDTRAILERVKHRIQRDFKASEYWFPSPSVHSSSHIKAVDATWQRTLHCLGSPPYPLRDFALSYRDRNNPSYFAPFLRQYGQAFREAAGAEAVSKTLADRKKYFGKSIPLQ